MWTSVNPWQEGADYLYELGRQSPDVVGPGSHCLPRHRTKGCKHGNAEMRFIGSTTEVQHVSMIRRSYAPVCYPLSLD